MKQCRVSKWNVIKQTSTFITEWKLFHCVPSVSSCYALFLSLSLSLSLISYYNYYRSKVSNRIIIVRNYWSELSNILLVSPRFKSFGNSVVFKKKNDAKSFGQKSLLAIKISSIRKLWQEKKLAKKSNSNKRS